MEPITFVLLAAAAGFIFSKTKGFSNKDESPPKELVYEPEIVAVKKKRKLSYFDPGSIEVLTEFSVVKMLIENDFPIIFVTGGAGTGKSTFVKWITNEFEGKVLLGAPTGIAAMNIGGKTLHSLCRLPPAWIVKKDIKYNPSRREIKNAKVLIIDEISMVNSNLLDGVSAFFRKNREIDKPFGGISVIFVGDMFQLPPVVSRDTKELYERIYGSPKFYNARCLNSCTYYAVELKKTFRQSDQFFVDILSNIREKRDIESSIDFLNTQCTLTDEPPPGAVWLSPRNSEVEHINYQHLENLNGRKRIFRGTIKGKFKTDRLPSPMELILKIGAQVMFTKNDKHSRWINGTIGTIKKMTKSKIIVILDETKKPVEVERETWTDYRYEWNTSSKEIDRYETGSYKQYPLVLAWAMTIHKSQGRTIDKVHLSLGNGAFETGQTYVALSRCREIRGLSMTRALSVSDVLVDNESREFYNILRGIIKKLPPEEMMKKIMAEKELESEGIELPF